MRWERRYGSRWASWHNVGPDLMMAADIEKSKLLLDGNHNFDWVHWWQTINWSGDRRIYSVSGFSREEPTNPERFGNQSLNKTFSIFHWNPPSTRLDWNDQGGDEPWSLGTFWRQRYLCHAKHELVGFLHISVKLNLLRNMIVWQGGEIPWDWGRPTKPLVRKLNERSNRALLSLGCPKWFHLCTRQLRVKNSSGKREAKGSW